MEKENYILWVERNRKAITEKEFAEQVGMSFQEFSRLYSRQTRKAWSDYIEAKKTDKKEPTISLAREKHLLRVISIWKRRYYALKHEI